MLNGKVVGFVGAGNMGEVLIRGLIQSGKIDKMDIIASDASPERLGYIASTYGIRTTPSNVELAESAVAAGVHPEHLAQLATLRPLQRMGEEIGDAELARFAALEADLDREFAELIHASEAGNATHG